MITRYRRKTMNQRFCNFCDDCGWWWEKNHEGVIGGFVLGALVVVIALELAWRA